MSKWTPLSVALIFVAICLIIIGIWPTIEAKANDQATIPGLYGNEWLRWDDGVKGVGNYTYTLYLNTAKTGEGAGIFVYAGFLDKPEDGKKGWDWDSAKRIPDSGWYRYTVTLGNSVQRLVYASGRDLTDPKDPQWVQDIALSGIATQNPDWAFELLFLNGKIIPVPELERLLSHQ